MTELETIYQFNDRIKPDFGWASPKRTKAECNNPDFHDHNLHRVAIMKNYHIGSIGDIEPSGLPGWCTKLVCNGCGRVFKYSWFYPDKE